jgi:hypothetical protein
VNEYVKPQPAPVPNDSAPVWPLVVEDFRRWAALPGVSDDSRRALLSLAEDGEARDAFGFGKYGVRLGVEGAPRDPAIDAYQEALDGCVYWRQEVERKQSPEAIALYGDATTLAVRARAYLLNRDGK